ncbi:hypothetical protein JCM18905_28 [Vibrio sp. JCM 18905]|nr:hypothetical protein JCM18905_28 [Vibrio sp. JCM 18905]
MELRNKSGEVAKIADNLTLKEITEMGYTVDLCDEAFDPVSIGKRKVKRKVWASTQRSKRPDGPAHKALHKQKNRAT